MFIKLNRIEFVHKYHLQYIHLSKFIQLGYVNHGRPSVTVSEVIVPSCPKFGYRWSRKRKQASFICSGAQGFGQLRPEFFSFSSCCASPEVELTLLAFALARGSVAKVLSSLCAITDHLETPYKAGSLIASMATVRQNLLYKYGTCYWDKWGLRIS